MHARIVECVRATLAGGRGVPEHQRVAAVARMVGGRAARVEPQLDRPRHADVAVECNADVYILAQPVHAAGAGRGDVGHRRRRQPDQLDAAAGMNMAGGATGYGHGVRGATQVERRNGIRVVDLGKTVRAIDRRAGRQQGAVAPAHVDQLDAATRRGCHGVRAAGGDGGDMGDAAGAREPGKAVRAAVGNSGRNQRAVPIHADQLDAAAAVGGDQGVDGSVQVERGYIARPTEIPAGAAGQRVQHREGAAFVYPDQMDDAVAVRRGEGVLFGAQVEHVHPERRGEAQVVAARQLVHGLKVAPVEAYQLDAVVVEPGDEGVQGAIQLKGCHPGGAIKLPVAVVE